MTTVDHQVEDDSSHTTAAGGTRPATVKVKIYGERNTGTNYLAKLIGLNFHVQLLRGVAPRPWTQQHGDTEVAKDRFFAKYFKRNLGWKHSLPCTRRALEANGINIRQILFVTITKNPYSWLLSLYKRPYHSSQRSSSFAEFLTTRWIPIGRENCVSDFRNPMDLWNCKNRSYLELFDSGLRTVNLRYEDVVCDPLEMLRQLAEQGQMLPRQKQFVNVMSSTKDSNKDFTYYQDYYMNERWRDKLTPEHVQIANTYLDHHLMRRFSYALL